MGDYRLTNGPEPREPRKQSILDDDVTTVDPVLVVAPRLKRAEAQVRAIPKHYVGHPGLLESLIPVLGPGREAIADFQDGDYLGALGNGALTVADLFPQALALKAVRAGRAFKMGSHTYGATHHWMKGKQMVEKGQEVHHWLIPQGGWGKGVPDVIKNSPFNLLPLEKTIHRRLHTKFAKQPRFGLPERLVRGTPTWSKAAAGSVVARPVGVTARVLNNDED